LGVVVYTFRLCGLDTGDWLAYLIKACMFARVLETCNPKLTEAVMFRVLANKGFQITFSNGYEISCMFGADNYASNRDRFGLLGGNTHNGSDLQSKDCEIAIYNPQGRCLEGWPDCHYGVAGWQTPDQFANLVAWVMQQRPSQAEVYSLIAAASSPEDHF
jgi:hypothetical protein